MIPQLSPLEKAANLALNVLKAPELSAARALDHVVDEVKANAATLSSPQITQLRDLLAHHAPLGKLRNKEFLTALSIADPERYRRLTSFYNEKGHPGCRFILPVDHPAWEHFGGDFSFGGKYEFSLNDMQRTVMEALAPYTGGNIISVPHQMGRMRLKENQSYVSFGAIEAEMDSQGTPVEGRAHYVSTNFTSRIYLDSKLEENLPSDQHLIAQWNSLSNPDGSIDNSLLGDKPLRTAGQDYFFEMAQLAEDVPRITVLKVAGMWDPLLPQTHGKLLEFMEREINAAHENRLLAFAENLPPETRGNKPIQVSFKNEADKDAYRRQHARWMLSIAVEFTQAAAAYGLDADMHKALLPNTLDRDSLGHHLISQDERDFAVLAMAGAAWRPIGWMSAGVPDLASAVRNLNESALRQGVDILQSGYFPGRSVF